MFHDNAIGQFLRGAGIGDANVLGKILTPTTIPPVFMVQGVALGVPQIVQNVRDVDDDR